MAQLAGSAVRTCFGDGEATFAALLGGRVGVGPLRYVDGVSVNVARGYHIDPEDEREQRYRAGDWLAVVVADALVQAGVDPDRGRIPVIVGTGLRELRAVERWATGDEPIELHRLHFGAAVRRVGAALGPVITLSNACSASGHALALAQDMVELGEAECVVAAGADAMTASMLAMIGRVTPVPTTSVRPFDVGRTGVLLGEGAAAVVVTAGRDRPGCTELLATGMSCDAHHETAPSEDGILRAMRDALDRCGRSPSDVDLVVTHGTGTALNDVTEAAVVRRLFGACPPVLTGVKGAVGHTSGAAALVNVDVAMRAMNAGLVPPVVGLGELLPEGAGLPFVRAVPLRTPVRLAQVNAFGFGGLNAVTLLGAVGRAT